MDIVTIRLKGVFLWVQFDSTIPCLQQRLQGLHKFDIEDFQRIYQGIYKYLDTIGKLENQNLSRTSFISDPCLDGSIRGTVWIPGSGKNFKTNFVSSSAYS